MNQGGSEEEAVFALADDAIETLPTATTSSPVVSVRRVAYAVRSMLVRRSVSAERRGLDRKREGREASQQLVAKAKGSGQ